MKIKSTEKLEIILASSDLSGFDSNIINRLLLSIEKILDKAISAEKIYMSSKDSDAKFRIHRFARKHHIFAQGINSSYPIELFYESTLDMFALGNAGLNRKLSTEILLTGEKLGLWKYHKCATPLGDLAHKNMRLHSPATIVLTGDWWVANNTNKIVERELAVSKPIINFIMKKDTDLIKEQEFLIATDEMVSMMHKFDKDSVYPSEDFCEGICNELVRLGYRGDTEFIEDHDTIEWTVTDADWGNLKMETNLAVTPTQKNIVDTVKESFEKHPEGKPMRWHKGSIADHDYFNVQCHLSYARMKNKYSSAVVTRDNGEKINNRRFSKFQMMPRWMRNEVLCKGERIVGLDATALHPNIIAMECKKRGIECDFLVGDSHDKIASILGVDRKKAKLVNLTYWNKDKNQKMKGVLKKFDKWIRENHKEVLDMLDCLNNTYKFVDKNDSYIAEHKNLSRVLFYYEAVILSDAMQTLRDKGILSNHAFDCLYVQEKFKEEAREAFNAALVKHNIETKVK